MAVQDIYALGIAALAVLTSVLVFHRKQAQDEERPVKKPYPFAQVPPTQLPQHIQDLLAKLPGSVVLQSDGEAFQQAVDCSWAQTVREIIPACIVRPRDVLQLSKAVVILNRENDRRCEAGEEGGFFSVRSGGVNPGLGAATIKDGVVVDLSHFCEVIPADDGSTVTLGSGAKWIDVYKSLDEKGLVVMGGRNSPVGVGGLTLQGMASTTLRYLCHLTSSDDANCRWYIILLAEVRICLLQCC